jgi:glycerol-3-phosphate dehydrogenase
MRVDIKKFESTQYDVLVVGGGINGASIAHMGALNGLKVALLEKQDFASGTSSKSTKLVHGGLRYLENFELGLVKEALRERSVQLKSAPHLVQELPIVIPVYKTDRRPLWMIKLGVTLYDFLSGKFIIKKHENLTPQEVVKYIPGIKHDDLLGGILYYDGQMDDARIVLENVLSARGHGADVANYVEVKALLKENGKAIGVLAYDIFKNIEFKVYAKKIVCAVGPWTNEFVLKEKSQAPSKVRTTKGVHIVYRGKISDKALLIPVKGDKRVFFIIPWFDNSLIGTTDTDFTESPDSLKVGEEDIQYLLSEARRIFPQKEFNENNIITTFAGLRPLVFEEGSPLKVSRRHLIEESYSGMFYVMGGKFTTYRKIAEDVIKKIIKKEIKDTSELFPIYGSGLIKENLDEMSLKYDVSREIIDYLIEVYGSRYKDVLGVIEEDPMLKAPLCNDFPMIKAQVVYAKKHEFAQSADDVIQRRLSLIYYDIDPNEYEPYIADFFKNTL